MTDEEFVNQFYELRRQATDVYVQAGMPFPTVTDPTAKDISVLGPYKSNIINAATVQDLLDVWWGAFGSVAPKYTAAMTSAQTTALYYERLFELVKAYDWSVAAITEDAVKPSLYKLKASGIVFTISGYINTDNNEYVCIKYKHNRQLAQIAKKDFENVANKLDS